MANNYEKTAFNGGNSNLVDSKQDSFDNKTSSGLTKSDLDNLANSFITQEIIEQAGLFRIDDLQGAEIVGRKPKAGSYYSGIVFPYFLPPNYNHPTQFRLRRDKPDYEKRANGTLKEIGKYLSAPGARNMLYFPPNIKVDWLTDVSIPIVITEGEKKTLALHRLSRHNLNPADKPSCLPIGLSGVWNWRGRVEIISNGEGKQIDVKGVIPDFNLIKWVTRKVFITFDTNAKTNPNVKAALRELAKEFAERNAIPLIVELPDLEGINGIDDLLGFWEKAHGTKEAIRRCLELFDKAKVFEGKEKLNQATRILNFADGLELFHTPDGEAFATIEINGHFENHFLRSKVFRNWLAHQFFKFERKMPAIQALQDAINTLEGKALFERPRSELFIRVASNNGKTYLDLCNDSWQIVEISKEGWQIIESRNAPVKFNRTKAMMPLPNPVRNGSIEKLKDFLNVEDNEYILILSWLVNCFRPNYPFPIIIITGEQGSAKSTISKIQRRLTDPNKTDFRSAPRDERDLVIAASNAWVCAYDNLSNVPAWLSDALCRISTGGGFATRTLYENSDETIFAAKRPILINGIGDIANRPDLLDRAITIRPKPIPANKRKTESEFWREFEKVEKEIFSGLLDVVVSALQNIESVNLKTFPRMADFAEWGTAAESALGFNEDDFIKAYEANRGNTNRTALEGSVFAETICKYCTKQNKFGALFTGNFQQFLDTLKPFADEETLKSKDYPKTPRGVRSKLERINPNLRAIGISIEFLKRTDNGQQIKLERICIQPSETSDHQDSKQTRDLMSDGSTDVWIFNQQEIIQPSPNRQIGKSKNYNDLNVSPDGSDDSDGLKQPYSEVTPEQKTMTVKGVI